jgi:CBS domain-containing protein
VFVRDVATKTVVTLRPDDTVEQVRKWIAAGGPGTSHQGYPVVEGDGLLVGVLTRRDFLDPAQPGEKTLRRLIRRPPSLCYDDNTLRDAADHMVNHDIGRLPVLSRATRKLVGFVTRGDILRAHRRRIDESANPSRTLELRTLVRTPWSRSAAASSNGH